MSQILLVDNCLDFLNVLNWTFQKSGISCSTAYYRQGLYNELLKYTPSLIMIDINLDEDDGRKICRELKTDSKTRDIPVILCSGNYELLSEYKSFLADDFIQKPFEIKTAMKKIMRFIKL